MFHLVPRDADGQAHANTDKPYSSISGFLRNSHPFQIICLQMRTKQIKGCKGAICKGANLKSLPLYLILKQAPNSNKPGFPLIQKAYYFNSLMAFQSAIRSYSSAKEKPKLAIVTGTNFLLHYLTLQYSHSLLQEVLVGSGGR